MLVLTLAVPRFATDAALAGLTAVNFVLMQWLLKHGIELPSLYDSEVRYRRERNRERWKNAAELLDDGEGDCEDLAAYQAAWYRVYENEPARAIAIATRRRRLLHSVVVRGDGETIEDPSRILKGGRR
jgi:hypothetical protein